DLPSEAELGHQEVAAVVAQLPRYVDEPLVEAEVEIPRLRRRQECSRGLGQEVREDEAADALERPGRLAAAPGRAGEVRGLGGEIAQEIVVDVGLAPRDERSQLREIHDVEITLTKDGELDRSARPVRHRPGGEVYQAPPPGGRACPGIRYGRRSSRKLVPIPG